MSDLGDKVRFWGRIQVIRPRLVLTKFGGETTAKSFGHLLMIEGTRTSTTNEILSGCYSVAIGPATLVEKRLQVGDLVRGDAQVVPETTFDLQADLYRVGVFRVIARAGDSGAATVPVVDPPRTDAPLPSDAAETASRRALVPTHLDRDGPCYPCPYGAMVAVVRVTDPRHYRNGAWSHVPACLGPLNCPHYQDP